MHKLSKYGKFIGCCASGAALLNGASCSPAELNAALSIVNIVADAFNGEDDDISFWDWLESELGD